MSWSVSGAAIARIVGNLRSPFLYSCSAASMYPALWPASFGSSYTSGKLALYSGMPWQPMHIDALALPAAASPLRSCASATVVTQATDKANAVVNSLFIFRAQSDEVLEPVVRGDYMHAQRPPPPSTANPPTRRGPSPIWIASSEEHTPDSTHHSTSYAAS